MTHPALTLERAIAIAALAHEGQFDKSGEPYILHPLRVMLAVPAEARRVAVLHDVLEDTDYEPAALQAVLLDWEWEALLHVTRPHEGDGRMDPWFREMPWKDSRPRATYREWIDRIAAAGGEAGRIARMVKVADVRDNLRPERWHDQADSMRGRYELALARLAEEDASRAEGVCDQCGRDYPTPWYAPNELWNEVNGGPEGFLCPDCFITRGNAILGPTIWKVQAE